MTKKLEEAIFLELLEELREYAHKEYKEGRTKSLREYEAKS